MEEIKKLLKTDMANLQVRYKKEYRANGNSLIYKGMVDDYKELDYFKFMINRYERKLRLKK